MVSWSEEVGSSHGLFNLYYPSIRLEGLSVRVAGYFPNWSQPCFRSANLLDLIRGSLGTQYSNSVHKPWRHSQLNAHCHSVQVITFLKLPDTSDYPEQISMWFYSFNADCFLIVHNHLLISFDAKQFLKLGKSHKVMNKRNNFIKMGYLLRITLHFLKCNVSHISDRPHVISLYGINSF
jgi:hypothetical protein